MLNIIILQLNLWNCVYYISAMLKDSEIGSEDSEIGSEYQLLEPVNLHVTVARNLSASWYHGRPDVELLGRLQEISVHLFFGCFNVWIGVVVSLFQLL